MHLDRVTAAGWFAVPGAACIVAGGFLAAVTAHAPTRHGVWAVAYLVLVAGVAQVALGAGQALLSPVRPSRAVVGAEFATWNLGNSAVIAGTVAGLAALVDVGGVLLVIALAMFVLTARGSASRWRRTRWAFRLVVLVLLVSIPVGLVLAAAHT